MILIPPQVLYAIPLLIAAVLMAALARTATQASDDPHTAPFVVMVVGASTWAFADALQVLTSAPNVSVIVGYASFLGAVVVPGAWFLFTLTYAWNVDPSTRWPVALLVIEPAITLLLVASDPWHGLIYQSVEPVAFGGLTVIQTVPGTWYWVNLVYSYLLVGGGILLLAQVAFSGDRLYRKQAGALVAGAIVPLAANIVFTFFVTDVTAVDYTALAFAATAVLFGLALYQFNLLQLVPVARNIVIEDLSDPIIVCNESERVVDSNPAARELFEGLTTGEDCTEFLPDTPSELAETEYTTTVDDRRRTYVVRRRQLHGRSDRPAGSVLLFSDVTEVAEREQRLDVLNRVLRHNVRTDANIIQGYLELATETHPDDVHIEQSLARVEQLVERSEKARRITETLEAVSHDPRPIPIRPVIETVIEELREEFPAAEIVVDIEDASITLPEERLLEHVVQNLGENALEHAKTDSPWLRISTGVTDDHVTLRFEDAGPGLPEAESATLAAERETQLTHSTGLGLWVVRWIASATGTRLEIGDRDPRGTIVSLSFDRAD